MKAIPRRLLVLGGGPAGVDRAQTVRRLGGEVALVEAAERVLDREPAPLGEALGEVLRRDGVELVLGVRGAPPIPVTQARTLPSLLLLQTPYCDSSAVPLTMGQLSRAERDRIDTRAMSQVLVEHAAIEGGNAHAIPHNDKWQPVPTNR
jgi:hypothetical protein